LATLQPIELDFEGAARAPGMHFVGMTQQDPVEAVDAEAMRRAGRVKVEAKAAALEVLEPERLRRVAREALGKHGQLARKARDIEDIDRAQNARHHEEIVDRLAV